MTGRAATAILISGRGSNMRALIRAAENPEFPAVVKLVIANRDDAAGLEFAAGAGIDTLVIDHRGAGSRPAFEAKIQSALVGADIQIVCLAGFMRVLSADFVDAWRDRIINIHPSLLPAFKGLDTHSRALAQGCQIHGASVHFVRSELDAGPIIVQGAVPVLAGDDEAALAARVLEIEHRIYPLALEWLAAGKLRVAGNRVLQSPGNRETGGHLIWPTGSGGLPDWDQRQELAESE